MQPIYRPYVHPTCADLAISELSFNLLTPPFNNSDTQISYMRRNDGIDGILNSIAEV